MKLLGEASLRLHVFNRIRLSLDVARRGAHEGTEPHRVGPTRPLITRRTGELYLETEMKVVKMQLKVCEGCGALWVRSLVCGVYCKRCELLLSDFPTPQSRKRPGRRARTLRQIACPSAA